MTTGGTSDDPVVFRLLGPQIIPSAPNSLAPRVRAVLAMVVASAGQQVSLERLLDGVWDEPPHNVRSALQVYAVRIRRTLRDAGIEVELRTGLGGYRLDVDPLSVDLFRFRELVRAAGDEPAAERKAQLFTEALDRWEEPLASVSGPWAAATRAELERERLAVEFARAEAWLTLGRASDVVATLSPLVGEYPLDEGLAVLMIRALTQAGRRAQAMAFYSRIRRALLDELGIEPSPVLLELVHGVTLSADEAPAPDIPATFVRGHITSGAEAVSSGRRRPMMLPPRGNSPVVGRERELTALTRMFEPASAVGGPVLLHGPVGFGTTVLATHAATGAVEAGWFPGGVLFAELRTAAPREVMWEFVRAFGVPAEDVPVDPTQLAALYRAQFVRGAGHRVLIVLDGAESADQVLPLLPPSDTCAVLITSRHELPDLNIAHVVDVLGAAHDPGDTEPEDRPAIQRRLEHYLREARKADLALDPLQGNDEKAAATALAWLETEQYNLRASVSLAAEQGFPELARDLARALYWFHASRGDWGTLAEVSDIARVATEQNGDRAGQVLMVGTLADCAAHLHQFDTAAEHYRWALTIHRELGDRHGEATMLTKLGQVQHRTEQFTEAARGFQDALDIFRTLGDQRGEAVTLANLGDTYRELGRNVEATNLYRRALADYREIADRRGEARVLRALGNALRDAGEPQASLDAYRGAVNALREIGDDIAVSEVLDLLGATLRAMGRDEEAANIYDRAFDAYRENPPDRSALPVGRLSAYLATPAGRRQWEAVLLLADRSRARDEQLTRLLQAHRDRPLNQQILTELLEELQNLADHDDDVATELASWLETAEREAPARGVGFVNNAISGTVTGTVIQARDIFGTTGRGQ